MVDALRMAYENDSVHMKKIDEFEEKYRSEDAIEWYTQDGILYRVLNHALRSNDIEIMLTYRLLITDLHDALANLHRQTVDSKDESVSTMMMCYRGAIISVSELKQYKANKGNYIFTRGFLSTSKSLDIAVSFIASAEYRSTPSWQPIVLSIEIGTSIKNTQPFACIDFISSFGDEEEVLFTPGAVFRIDDVETLSPDRNIQVIRVIMVDESEVPSNLLNDSSPPLREQDSGNYIHIGHNHADSICVDYICSVVGWTSIFESDEQSNRVKSFLEACDIHFFDSFHDLEEFQKSSEIDRPLRIFTDSQSKVPTKYERAAQVSIIADDTHINDLTYQLLHATKRDEQTAENHTQNVYINLANILCHSSNSFAPY